MHYVYMIQSLVDGDLYKGSTEDYVRRLEQHNNGESRFTSIKCPWKLVYVEAFDIKSAALKREKQLKRCNRTYLNWLINQPVNFLNQ
jgi:putative endonuclease